MSAITPIDYLDQALPRLGLENLIDEVRRRTETILVLAATDYQFAYHNPSLMAASAIMIALQSLSSAPSLPMTGIKTRLQAATHTSIEQIDKCAQAIDAVLPESLKRLSSNLTKLAPADSTTPDLTCHEQLSLDGNSNSE